MSNQPYDSTKDTQDHISLVQKWIRDFCHILTGRGSMHDFSKLNNPTEKEMFDIWRPELDRRTLGSPEYQDALKQMGEGLKLHYLNNSHHPEHYENGIAGMTLYDLVEMVCDWMAAAEGKGVPVDMDYLQKRFDISPQLRSIIENQFREIDVETISNNMPRNIFLKTWKK
jgi:hypothetical protein